jgi:hypothetical protein
MKQIKLHHWKHNYWMYYSDEIRKGDKSARKQFCSGMWNVLTDMREAYNIPKKRSVILTISEDRLDGIHLIKKDVKKVIRFFEKEVDNATGFTVHCWRGIARSTAVALGLLYMIHGVGFIHMAGRANGYDSITEEEITGTELTLSRVALGFRAVVGVKSLSRAIRPPAPHATARLVPLPRRPLRPRLYTYRRSQLVPTRTYDRILDDLITERFNARRDIGAGNRGNYRDVMRAEVQAYVNATGRPLQTLYDYRFSSYASAKTFVDEVVSNYGRNSTIHLYR